MKTLIVFVGAQGSGKTELSKNYNGAFRVSQDDDGRRHKQLFDDAIRRGEPLIVVDKTNPSAKQRRRYLEPAKANGYLTEIVWLDVDRKICLERIKRRMEHPTLRPEKAEEALDAFFGKLEPPTRDEADKVVRCSGNTKRLIGLK